MDIIPDEVLHQVLSALPQVCIHHLQVCKQWQHLGMLILRSRSKIPEMYDNDAITAVISGVCIMGEDLMRKIFSDYYLTIRLGRKFAKDNYKEVITADNYHTFALICDFIINHEKKYQILGCAMNRDDTRILEDIITLNDTYGFLEWQDILSDATYCGNISAFKLIMNKIRTMNGDTNISNNMRKELYYNSVHGNNLELLNYIRTIFSIDTSADTIENTIKEAIGCSACNILDAYYKYRKNDPNSYIHIAIYHNKIKSALYIIDADPIIISDDNLVGVLKLSTYQKSKYFDSITKICISRGIMDYNVCSRHYILKCVSNSHNFLTQYDNNRMDIFITNATNHNECILLALQHGSSWQENIKIIRKLLPYVTNHNECAEYICGHGSDDASRSTTYKIMKLLVDKINNLNRCLYVATVANRPYLCKRLIKFGATNYNKSLYKKYGTIVSIPVTYSRV